MSNTEKNMTNIIFDKDVYARYLHQLAADNSILMRDFKKLFFSAMDNYLTDRQRDILRLYYLDNMKQHEISELLNINQSVVSRHIKRAKQNLSLLLSYNLHFHSGE